MQPNGISKSLYLFINSIVFDNNRSTNSITVQGLLISKEFLIIARLIVIILF